MFEGTKKIIRILRSQCPSTKIILLVGFLCLINVTASIFFKGNNSLESTTTINSVLSSIFGYIFGKHCIPNALGHEGIQALVAGTVAIISLAVLIIINWGPITTPQSDLSEIRNLLLTSVGFLISKVKNEDSSCSK